MSPDEMLSGLPGEDLIREGLADVRLGRRTIPALLIAVALPRLRRAGIVEEISRELQDDSELQIYRLLGSSDGDAYSQYNALIRRLVAFEQALDHRMQRACQDTPFSSPARGQPS